MERQSSIIGWLALIIAVVALILGWVAFNRSGADIEAIIQEEAEQRAEELRAEFNALEAEFRANTASELEEAAEDVATDTEDTTDTINE